MTNDALVELLGPLNATLANSGALTRADLFKVAKRLAKKLRNDGESEAAAFTRIFAASDAPGNPIFVAALRPKAAPRRGNGDRD